MLLKFEKGNESSNEKFKHHQQDLSFEITPDNPSSLGNQIYFAIDEIQPSKNLKW